MSDKQKNLIATGMFAVHCMPELVRALDQHVSELGLTRSGFVRQAVVAALLGGAVELSEAASIQPRRYTRSAETRALRPAA